MSLRVGQDCKGADFTRGTGTTWQEVAGITALVLSILCVTACLTTCGLKLDMYYTIGCGAAAAGLIFVALASYASYKYQNRTIDSPTQDQAKSEIDLEFDELVNLGKWESAFCNHLKTASEMSTKDKVLLADSLKAFNDDFSRVKRGESRIDNMEYGWVFDRFEDNGRHCVSVFFAKDDYRNDKFEIKGQDVCCSRFQILALLRGLLIKNHDFDPQNLALGRASTACALSFLLKG